MYLKRTSKFLDLSVSRATANVHIRDFLCPVCRGILIEPVTLPCTHNLCLRCLKGTFEHNSLTCPLCRVRVGSWLRNATKSETLVNHNLWELVRTKFPKEVENKHNGEERDLDLDVDYATNRRFSAPGEIRKEFEAQLQMVEEEKQRRREAERMASEALIQKIQAEEQQMLLAQLAQDQLLAKTMAKQQVAEKQKETTKCYNHCLNTSVSRYVLDAPKFKTVFVNNVEAPAESAQLAGRQMSLPDSSKMKQTNVVLDTETIHSGVHCSNEINTASVQKDPVQYCQKRIPVYNAIAKKHHTSKFPQACTSNYPADPGCSTSGTYCTETKEELRIPSDVVNNKKKSLGIEVCMTVDDDDERIGSAESSGSHDSINQEIHHFKPIKTVPRTELKISSDGKPINPKLIRTIPILKKIPNAVPKPPSPTRAKRIIGCSWSAFKGRIRQDAKRKQAAHNSEDTELVITNPVSIDQKPSTSALDCSLTMSYKLETKYQANDATCRLDFAPESSFDSNKNYTKNTSKIINGTKVGKKMSEDESDIRKLRKSWRGTRVRNSAIMKLKIHRNLRSNRKGSELVLKATDEEDNGQADLSFDKASLRDNEQDSNDIVIENIAEKVKRRKENKTSVLESNVPKGSKTIAKKRASPEGSDESSAANQVSSLTDKPEGNLQRTKQRKINRTLNNKKRPERSQLSMTVNNKLAAPGWRKSTRNLTKNSSSQAGDSKLNNTHNSKFSYDSPPESCDETELCVPENNRDVEKDCSDEEVLEQQQRIERLLLQEQKDYELARRLQAQFDEMEQIAMRTRRGLRRNAEVELRAVDNVTRTICETSNNTRKTVKRKSAAKQVVNTAIKRKCSRPPKRTKEETRVR